MIGPTAISSGVIVLSEIDGELRLALAHEADKGPDAMVLPKGHVEGGETLEETALREVAEEVGLVDIRLIIYLGAIERESVEDNGETVLKTIHMFLGFCPTPTGIGSAGDWLTIERALEVIPFSEDREFVADRLGPLLRTSAGRSGSD